MNKPFLLLNTALIGAEMMLALIGLVLAILIPAASRWNKRFFICFFGILVLYGLACIADGIISSRPDAVTGLHIIYYFETLLYLVLQLKITLFLHRCCEKDWRKSPFFRTCAVLLLVSLLALSMAPFTSWFYEIDPRNQLVRGPLYIPFTAILTALQILNVAFVVRWRNCMSRRLLYTFIFGLVPLLIAEVIHLFVSVFTLLGFGLSACALSMLGALLIDQVERQMRQQREIANQHASIMVLQMRPHFIYNTMMSIYYLCKQDPDLAQQVTLDFTTYLRRNFTAIASEDLIPFTEELEHTRAYLAVEQAQFEDRLLVRYDTPCVGFLLPPLTLQPIVENAVKHGMDPEAESLQIDIRTAETRSGYEITIEDTGFGFGANDSEAPHVALENISQRLALMCHGKMTISPRDGGGTAVVISIPRTRENRAAASPASPVPDGSAPVG